MENKEMNVELKPAVKRVLITILENSLIVKTNSLTLNLEGLRIKSLIREPDKEKIKTYLDTLRENAYITTCEIKGDEANITVGSKIKLPDFETSQLETIEENVIKRAIIFRLFEETKKTDYIVNAAMPLTELTLCLQVRSDKEIPRIAAYLKDIGLLESPYMDGGKWISYLTTAGMELSKTADMLMSKFPTIDIEPVKTMNNDEPKQPSIADPRKVFVVHGRNEMARVAMFTFLRAIGLEPIEWSEAVKLTGTASPYIGEVLDAAFSHAQAIVVLLTGDDLARLGDRFTINGESDERLTPQARPNVIFEAGLAFGRDPDRTLLVQLGDTRAISDLAGRHIIKMDGSVKKRNELAGRLKSAGCSIQIEHRTDWHSVGDFNDAVAYPDSIGKLVESSTKNANSGNTNSKDNIEVEQSVNIFCSRCGAKPGQRSNCVGNWWEHDFEHYNTTVMCSRCGVKPGQRSVCVGDWWEHDFREFK